MAARLVSLLVSDEELAERALDQPVKEQRATRGYRKLFLDTVMQADQGVDFDFLRACAFSGAVPKPD